MSGPLRKLIGPASKRMKEYLDAVEDEKASYGVALDQLDHVKNLENVSRALQKVEYRHKMIQSAEQILKTNYDDWKKLMEKMGDESRSKEEKIFDEFINSTTKPEAAASIDRLGEGQEALIFLEARKDELIYLKEKLQLKVNIASAAATPENTAVQPPVAIGSGFAASSFPKIKNKKFDGSPYNAMEFWDWYEVTIEGAPISNYQKLVLLTQCLEGKALKAVAGYQIIEANYRIIKKELMDRFLDKEIIKRAYFSELSTLKKAKYNCDDLRQLSEDVDRLCRQLEQVGQDMDHPSIMYSIEGKLPSQILEKIYESKRKKPLFNVSDLRKKLRETVELMEEVNRTYQVESAGKQTATFSAVQKQNNKKSSDNSNSQKSKNCCFCKGNHDKHECSTYDDTTKRREQAKTMRLCWICLQPKHMKKDCKSGHKENHPLLRYDTKQDNNKESKKSYNNNKHQQVQQEQQQKSFSSQKKYKSGANVVISSQSQLCEDMNNMQLNEVQETKVTTQTLNTITKTKGPKSVLLSATYATVCNPNYTSKKAEVLILLDNGSHHGYISKELKQFLGLKIHDKEEIQVFTFGNKTPVETCADVVQVDLQQQNGTTLRLTLRAVDFITEEISVLSVPQVNQADLKKCEIRAEDIKNQKPDILIGNDMFWNIVGHPIANLNSGFKIIDSTIGPIIAGEGKIASGSKNEASFMAIERSFKHYRYKSEEPSTNELLKSFLDTETIGISDNPHQDDDEVAMKMFDESIKYNEDEKIYYVKWPFKTKNPKTWSNFNQCFARLKSTYKQLKKQNLLEEVEQIYNDQLKRGFTEEIQKDEADGLMIYLPQHAVLRLDKNTTKVRMVSDASCKPAKNEASANDLMFKGPDLMNDLVGVILRMRLPNVVVCCDIEKAFHTIGLQPDQRDITRFLWVKDINKPPSIENLKIMRFKRLIFGAIAAPFMLNATIKHHLKKHNSNLAKEIELNTYVDNIFLGADTAQKAIEKQQKAEIIFNECSMPLREYASNSEEVMKNIPENKKYPFKVIKVLGVPWDTSKDYLEIKLPKVKLDGKLSKRMISSAIASAFDPLGLITPTLIPAKLLLQQLWLIKLDWDDLVPEEIRSKFEEMVAPWAETTFSIPRKIAYQNIDRLELHCFTDSSGYAYGAVVYLRVENCYRVSTNIVFSKTRLAPLEGLSIPRLELLGILVGSKALKFVKKQLQINIEDVYLWSDSSCCLQWLKMDRVEDVFVSNRLKQIHVMEEELNIQFRHVRTNYNPADLASRGIKQPSELMDSSIWWYGPPFLGWNKQDWPSSPIVYKPAKKEDSDIEIIEMEVSPAKKPKKMQKSLFTVSAIAKMAVKPEEYFIDASRYRNWNLMCRVTIIALRFIKKLKNDTEVCVDIKNDGPFLAEEYSTVITLLVKLAQKEKPPSSKEFKDRDLFMDPKLEVYRCGGRLKNSALPYNTVHPFWLPKKHPTTRALILHVHVESKHSGPSTTLAKLRDEFWVSSGKRMVKKFLNYCFTCKRYKSLPFQLPEMAQLPEERVMKSSPFTYCGVDNFGWLNVREAQEVKKVWVTLFSCMSTRAIHLELVESLSAEAFLEAMRQFISRRGKPKKMWSDNAGNFRLTEKILEEAWSKIVQSEEVMNYCSTEGIAWKFIPERAPFFGGFYERMVGVVKAAMKVSLGKKLFTVSSLRTLLCEVEAIVNSRPIVATSDDPPIILRPIDFLLPGKRQVGVPMLNGDNSDEEYRDLRNLTSKDNLLEFWRLQQKTLDKFWKNWSELYIKNLREKHQKMHTQHFITRRAPEIGEVVIIDDENMGRAGWKLGVIEEFSPSADHLIRSALVRTSKEKKLRRPINLLYPLEIRSPKIENFQTSEKTKESEQSIQKKVPEMVQYRKSELSTTPVNPLGSHISENEVMQTTGNSSKMVPIEAQERDDGPISYRTRRQTNTLSIIPKKLPFFFFLLAILGSQVEAKKCVVRTGSRYTVEKSPICRDRGIVILRNEEGQWCHAYVTCPPGHHLYALLGSRTTYMRESDLTEKFCGSACACSGNLSACSFYNGPSTILSTVENPEVATFLAQNSPRVCSFDLPFPPQCDYTIKETLFNFVVLFDDKKVYIQSPKIVFSEYKPEEFTCFGEDQRGLWNGVDAFCEHYQCNSDAKKYCYYDQPEIIYLTDEKSTYKIPIKAFGYERRQFLSFKMKKEEFELYIDCNKEGAFVRSSSANVSHMEACVKPFCETVEKLPSQVTWPKSVLITNYMMEIKAHLNGYEKIMKHQCPAIQICETFDCVICKEAVENPECLKERTIIALVVVAFAGIACMVIVAFVIAYKCWESINKLVKKVKFWIRRCIMGVIRRLLPTHVEEDVKASKPSSARQGRYSYSPTRNITSILIGSMAVLLFLMTPAAFGCRYTFSYMATENSCVKDGETEKCTYENTTLLEMIGHGETCLLFKTPEKVPAATATFEVLEMAYECNPPIVSHYTRSFTAHTEFIKRCPSKGSCVEQGCANQKRDVPVPELDGANAKFPGEYGCHSSCGCFLCGCFWCQPACTFLHNYVLPLSDRVITFFTCPDLTPKIKMLAKFSKHNETKSKILNLFIGEEVDWQGLGIRVVQTSFAPAPGLSAPFMTDGNRTMLVSAHEFEASRTMTCHSYEDAQNMKNCELDRRWCNCHVTDPSITCDCNDFDSDRLFEAEKQRILPISLADYKLYPKLDHNIGVSAKLSHTSAFELAVKSKMEVETSYTKTQCKVLNYEIDGCFSCYYGAVFNYTCLANVTTSAHVHCQSASFELDCSPELGHKNKHLFFDHAKIEENCTISCNKENSTFFLAANLHPVENEHQAKGSSKTASEKTIPWIPELPNGQKIVNWIKEDFLRPLYILGGIVGLVAVIYILSYINCLCKFCKKCKKLKKSKNS